MLRGKKERPENITERKETEIMGDNKHEEKEWKKEGGHSKDEVTTGKGEGQQSRRKGMERRGKNRKDSKQKRKKK